MAAARGLKRERIALPPGHANPSTMVPAEKISTIPIMTEANQPQFRRPIIHMKPVPMTASVATEIPMGPVKADSTDSNMVWIGERS